MKKTTLTLAIVLGIFQGYSQNSTKPWNIGLDLGTKDYRGDLGSGILFKDVNINPGIRVNRFLNKSFDAGLNFSFGRFDYSKLDSSALVLNSANGNAFRSRVIEGGLNLVYKFNNGYILNENSKFAPYLTAGIGMANVKGRSTAYNNNTSSVSSVIVPLGAGVKYAINEKFNLFLQSTYNLSMNDKFENIAEKGKGNDKFLNTTLGVSYNFGKGKETSKDNSSSKETNVKSEVTNEVNNISKSILFETNSDKIKEESYPSLDKLAFLLKSSKKLKLDISGHTDNAGDRNLNMELSRKRAESVKNYLIAKGVSPDALMAQGFGPDKPIDTNDTPEGRANNRRVELKVHY